MSNSFREKMKDFAIGNTPLYRLSSFSEFNIYAKIESANLTGSIKDRAALKILLDAIDNGLKKGSCVVEATSGNMGISFAALSPLLGLKAVIVLPENMSEERKSIIRAYGAELVETPASLGMSGAVQMAEKIATERVGSFMPKQFENKSNAMAHYLSTAEEIYEQTLRKVDVLVAGIGTGGTISGTARYLKEQNSNIHIIGVEPKSSPLLTQGKFGSHKIQGIGANFIPKVLDRSIIDEIVDVADEDAFAFAKNAAKNDGVMCGISSGAAISAAVSYAKKDNNAKKNIVVILPDSGMKYLSMGLYR